MDYILIIFCLLCCVQTTYLFKYAAGYVASEKQCLCFKTMASHIEKPTTSFLHSRPDPHVHWFKKLAIAWLLSSICGIVFNKLSRKFQSNHVGPSHLTIALTYYGNLMTYFSQCDMHSSSNCGFFYLFVLILFILQPGRTPLEIIISSSRETWSRRQDTKQKIK